jgi:hypothetical protein
MSVQDEHSDKHSFDYHMQSIIRTEPWTKEEIIATVKGCARISVCPLCLEVTKLPPHGVAPICSGRSQAHPHIKPLIMVPEPEDDRLPFDSHAILKQAQENS